ncbi:hypothetical protein RA210_U290009 [Rubrivivax sp. A210]|nr:hypothetical protein RA210_U290009 [Rubrivivax sp. A210]
MYILCGRGLAFHRRCQLSSNVRRRSAHFALLPTILILSLPIHYEFSTQGRCFRIAGRVAPPRTPLEEMWSGVVSDALAPLGH